MTRFFGYVCLLLVLSGCIQTTKITLEYINPPISLTVTQVAPQTYRLSFFSDNREGGFVGYGIFTSAGAAGASLYPGYDIASAAAFCNNSGQANYKTTVTIEIGPSASGGTLCNNTALLLNVGDFVALRGRVERTEKPWSEAAIAQIP